MAFPGTSSGSNVSPAGTWMFNPPPGWPAPPPGWQPPAGWQPDPSWPPPPAGWNFWVPAAQPYGYTSPYPYAAAQRQHDPDALKTVFGTLFPVRNWLHNPGWRQWTRLLIIPYALLPLIYLIVFENSSNTSAPGWAYALYIAPLWALGFWLLIGPGHLGKREWSIMGVVIVWTVIWMYLITGTIEAIFANGDTINLFSAIVIGVDEELSKALPVLVIGLFLKRRNIMLDVRMWMFMGAIAGLVFGVIEASGYTALFASNTLHNLGQANTVAQANNAEVQFILGFAERVFVDGLQHAVWAAISGFFMGIAVNYRRRRGTLIVLGIGIPSLLHALNDFIVGGVFTGDIHMWVWIVIQAVSVVLFLSYTMSAHLIEETVRDSPVFRGESMIMDVSALRAQYAQQPAQQQPLQPQPFQAQQPPQQQSGWPQPPGQQGHNQMR